MNTQKLKVEIANKVIEIKQLKKILRQDHSNLKYGGSNEMYQLYLLRCEIRAMYLVYAWFRGRRADQVEMFPLYPGEVSHYVKKFLDEERYPLFAEWLKSTYSKTMGS